ncbi:MAG: hypothetical protein WBO93_02015 [Gammaproteobacteria bacterium]
MQQAGLLQSGAHGAPYDVYALFHDRNTDQITSSIDDFSCFLPEDQRRISAQRARLFDWLAGLGVDIPSSIGREMLGPCVSVLRDCVD